MTLVLYLSLYVENSCLVRGAYLGHAKNQPHGTLDGSTVNKQSPPTAEWFQGLWLYFQPEERQLSFFEKGRKLRPRNLRWHAQSTPTPKQDLQFSSVQSLSRVRLFGTPWIATRQAYVSITNSRTSLRLMAIESVIPSSHLILCHHLLLLPQSLPASESFPMSQLFAWGGQSTGVSALASFLPKKSQGWSSSEWTGWISLQSKGLSRVFSNTTV